MFSVLIFTCPCKTCTRCSAHAGQQCWAWLMHMSYLTYLSNNKLAAARGTKEKYQMCHPKPLVCLWCCRVSGTCRWQIWHGTCRRHALFWCGSWWPDRMPEGIARALKAYMCTMGLNFLSVDNFNVRMNEKDWSPIFLTPSLKQVLHAKPQTALGRVNWHCWICPSRCTSICLEFKYHLLLDH